MSRIIMKRYKDDNVIVRQGDNDRSLYKVLTGNVALFINHNTPEEYLVGIVSAPHCFGEMSVLTGAHSHHTVVALGDVEVLQVPEDCFDDFIKENHINAMDIMKNMAKKFSMLNMNMNLLMDEIAELSKTKDIDPEVLKNIVKRDDASDMESSYIEEEEVADIFENLQILGDALNIDVSGHKGYQGIRHPEYEDFVFDKEYTCPHCKQKFTGTRIFRSKLATLPRKSSEMRYDLHDEYKCFETEWYDIVTCPHCCFSTFESIFLQNKVLKKQNYEESLNKIKEELKLDIDTEKDLEFVFSQHYIAMVCAQGYKNFKKIRARIWQNLYWLYKSAGDDEMINASRAKVIEAYTNIFTTCALTSAQEQRVCLTIAQMEYESGNMQEAKQWAHKAYANKFGKKMYLELARRFFEDISEEIDENAEYLK